MHSAAYRMKLLNYIPRNYNNKTLMKEWLKIQNISLTRKILAGIIRFNRIKR